MSWRFGELSGARATRGSGQSTLCEPRIRGSEPGDIFRLGPTEPTVADENLMAGVADTLFWHYMLQCLLLLHGLQLTAGTMNVCITRVGKPVSGRRKHRGGRSWVEVGVGTKHWPWESNFSICKTWGVLWSSMWKMQFLPFYPDLKSRWPTDYR